MLYSDDRSEAGNALISSMLASETKVHLTKGPPPGIQSLAIDVPGII